MRTYGAEDFRGRFYAHRGLHSPERGVPENSLAAFRAAAEKGCGVELDVQLSLDGQVVVFHDDTLDRVCGVQGRVTDRTAGDLQRMRLMGTGETIPLFTSVLDVLSRGSGPLIVELKTCARRGELCRKTLAILSRYPGAFCVESFDPRIVRWFRKNAPEVFRGQLAQPAEDYPRALPRPAARLLGECRLTPYNRPHFIAYKIGERPERVLRLRRKGVLLFAWTSLDAGKDALENDAVIFERCVPPDAWP